MTIEVLPEELYALADTLRAGSELALDVQGPLLPESFGGPLQAAVEEFTAGARAAAGALAGELGWLGDTVAGVADSWLGLDGSLLPARGTALPR
ncbi:hypothetical protein GB931_19980 [Modestobacter sp. I12A-02628]|uniref:Uncharacterized protein n=1 Tax=Goekera deserti TaxID=2497753 RepID=A0A7K3W9V4_9ACTN|nr:hypothetical protein [Goekera deserti]MPR00153.1 hypothetical protein [Goekera deserti]NDI49327.1 hypothetical protein [Goekera deserti]NEL52799.1 hypothetical protein [Goekera deserti]